MCSSHLMPCRHTTSQHLPHSPVPRLFLPSLLWCFLTLVEIYMHQYTCPTGVWTNTVTKFKHFEQFCQAQFKLDSSMSYNQSVQLYLQQLCILAYSYSRQPRTVVMSITWGFFMKLGVLLALLIPEFLQPLSPSPLKTLTTIIAPYLVPHVGISPFKFLHSFFTLHLAFPCSFFSALLSYSLLVSFCLQNFLKFPFLTTYLIPMSQCKFLASTHTPN